VIAQTMTYKNQDLLKELNKTAISKVGIEDGIGTIAIKISFGVKLMSNILYVLGIDHNF